MKRTGTDVRRLTAAGEGGIAVLAVRAGEAGALDSLFARRASKLADGAIAHGWLTEDGRRLDEVLVWRAGDGWEVGLHGGDTACAAAMRALRRAGARDEAAADGTVETAAAALLPHASTLAAAMFLASAADGALTRELESGDPQRLRALATRAAAGRALAHPRTVVLAGVPNAGKSTLFNALALRDRSLVHPQAGTTRDPVETLADLGGYPVRVVDTAGLAGATAGVDAAAEAEARRRIAAADLVVWLEDPAAPAARGRRGDFRVSGKCDLGTRLPGLLAVSGLTGEGVDLLARALVERLGLPFPADARPAPFADAHDLLVAAALARATSGP
jgi:tRNA U34 5-carboxymethylaminomethyl modifying GTPase MnmE/TrmE